jgi:hypothetical protein
MLSSLFLNDFKGTRAGNRGDQDASHVAVVGSSSETQGDTDGISVGVIRNL